VQQATQVRVAVVATRALADLVRRQAARMPESFAVTLIESSPEAALEAVDQLRRGGRLDAVIAAGQGADYLRGRLSLPVVSIRVTGYDILRALAEARLRNDRTVLLTRRRLADEVEALGPILSIDLTSLIYDADADAKRHLDELAAGSRPVVVGSSQVVHWAEAVGLQAVLIYSADSVEAAFESARELARIARLEEAKRERLDSVLESLAEGVAAVDDEERLQAINPALARLIGVSADWAIGRRLSDLEPALSLASVLRNGDARRDEIASVGGRRLVTQRLPLIEGGAQVGAVLTLQESAAIERADRKLRADARRRPFRARYTLADVLGESPAMKAARDMAYVYASADSSVLIIGASGTGKEMFAQGIHAASARKTEPFVALNCAAFPESLLESELFGYEEGAFTGSRRGGKPGLIELADRGTLFLDEIGDMPLPLQTRLLRVLQEREVLRLGASEPIPVDVRVIAATHADLHGMASLNRFRFDLFYRLNILTLRLPTLVERGEDLRLLAEKLAADTLRKLSVEAPASALTGPLMRVAAGHPWPGNVRELQNIVERLAVFLRVRQALSESDVRSLAPELRAMEEPASMMYSRRQHALEVLAACGGDKKAAAEKMGVSRTTFWRLLKDD